MGWISGKENIRVYGVILNHPPYVQCVDTSHLVLLRELKGRRQTGISLSCVSCQASVTRLEVAGLVPRGNEPQG